MDKLHVPDGHALVLRTAGPNGESHNGFVWPQSGPVSCDDWEATGQCGNGLHGLLWGEGNGHLLSWAPEARWMIVDVIEEDCVDLGGKIKFPRGTVVYCGDRLTATNLLLASLSRAASVVGCTLTGGDLSTLTGGDRSTLTGGYGSTLTGGYGSTLTGGDRSTLTGGDGSSLTGGDRSTLTGGYGSSLTGGDRSTLTGGDGSTLTLSFFGGRRKRIVTLHVGEDGIEPGVAYRLDDEGNPTRAIVHPPGD